jgi:hypothetical protein
VTPPPKEKDKTLVGGSRGSAEGGTRDKDDGYRIASAGNDEPKAKESKEASAPKDAGKKADSKAPAKSGKGTDEADKVLKAAMGATENTL